MTKRVRLIKITRWIAVVLSAFAISTILFPFASETLLDGTIVYYPTITAIIGGDFTYSDLSNTYIQTFHINIWLIITYQLAWLSSVAFFFSGRKKTNLIFALVLAFISMVAMIFMPYIVRFSTPGFVLSGVRIGYGPMLGAAALLLSQITALFHILIDERYR